MKERKKVVYSIYKGESYCLKGVTKKKSQSDWSGLDGVYLGLRRRGDLIGQGLMHSMLDKEVRILLILLKDVGCEPFLKEGK